MSRAKKRKVSKPERPSRSLKTIKRLAAKREWVAMITFKSKETINEEESNKLQRYLGGLLRRELRGNQIGFLLVREFGIGTSEGENPDRSHFHVVVSKQVPPAVIERLKNSFLRHCNLPNNQYEPFQYKPHTKEGPCTFGKYVSKLEKSGIDVINPPAHWDYQLLIRPYLYGFLASSQDNKGPMSITNWSLPSKAA